MQPYTKQRNFLNIPVSPIPVYFVIVAYFLCSAVNSLTLNSGLYNKVCYQKYRDLGLCSNYTFTENHPEIQDESADWNNYIMVLSSVPTVFVLLLHSTYCDKVGFKMPMILSCISLVFSSVSLFLFVNEQFINWPIWLILIYTLVGSLLGNSYMVLMTGFGYVALATKAENRGISLALAEGCLLFGAVGGIFINGPITDNWGLEANLYISTGLSVLIILTVIFLFTDISKETAKNFFLKELFYVRNLFEAVKCVFKSRPSNTRLILLLTFLAYGIFFAVGMGTSTPGYLYFVKEIGMKMTYYSIFDAIGTLCKSIGAPLILTAAKYLKLDALKVGVTVSIVSISSYIILYLNEGKLYLIWLGSLLACGNLGIYGIIRGLQAKTVGKDELSKMFAFDAVMQILVNTCVTVAYNSIYQSTITYWPASYYAVSAGLSIAGMIVLCILSIITSNDSSEGNVMYENLEKEPSE